MPGGSAKSLSVWTLDHCIYSDLLWCSKLFLFVWFGLGFCRLLLLCVLLLLLFLFLLRGVGECTLFGMFRIQIFCLVNQCQPVLVKNGTQ